MPDFTISGIAHDPDTGDQLVGYWTIDRYPSSPVPLADLMDNLRPPVSVYARDFGRESSVTLEGTTGDQLYWMHFRSSDRETELGPFLFALTADTTWDAIMADPAPFPGGGGSEVEYARFVGTATGPSDGVQIPLTWVAQPGYDLPAWASTDGSIIHLEGPIIGAMLYRYDGNIDGTGTDLSTADRSPDTDMTILFSRDGGNFDNNAGGPYYFVPEGTPGQVFEFDAVEEMVTDGGRFAGNETLRVIGTVNCFAYDAAGDPVTDAVLNADAAVVWIYRLPNPTLPA